MTVQLPGVRSRQAGFEVPFARQIRADDAAQSALGAEMAARRRA